VAQTEFTLNTIGTFYSVYALVDAGRANMAGRLSDRIGRAARDAAGMLLTGVAFRDDSSREIGCGEFAGCICVWCWVSHCADGD